MRFTKDRIRERPSEGWRGGRFRDFSFEQLKNYVAERFVPISVTIPWYFRYYVIFPFVFVSYTLSICYNPHNSAEKKRRVTVADLRVLSTN